MENNSTFHTLKDENKTVLIGSLSDELPSNLVSPFAVLLPATNKSECMEVKAIATAFLDKGCIDFCFVGKYAESLHDFLDCMIEDQGMFSVVTTAHLDEVEACEYFLFAAGGGSVPLLALVMQNENLLNFLKNTIKTDS